MSEKSQIDVRAGSKVIRVFSGWGIPRNILPALRAAANSGATKPLDIAWAIMKNVPDASFGLHLIREDHDEDDLSYRYTVDVSAKPWRVAQTKMPGHKIIINGSDNTFIVDPNLTPAVTRSYRIEVNRA